MVNVKHQDVLDKGVEAWNQWRKENPNIQPDLSRSDLTGKKLDEADFTKVNFNGTRFYETSLYRVSFSESDLTNADLTGVNLFSSTLTRTILNKTILKRAYIRGVSFTESTLIDTDFTFAHLVETDFSKSTLEGCHIYGIAAWELNLKEAKQSNLIITPQGGTPIIKVDNLEIAQFIYLLLHNENIRYIIDTITTKVILIIGRFTKERKTVLDTLREELRKYDYVPVMFDFERPTNRGVIETVSTLAHLARFVIADVTDPKIVLEEIPHIAQLAVPIIPLLLEGSGDEPVTLNDLRINHLSILDTYRYKNRDDLLVTLKEKVINPAESKVAELENRRNKQFNIQNTTG